ncbi:RlpA-like double-psi beta-barrel-protein domain-containing protein-containing protein [Cokeromyces recurvatus]|uniref:RlpA-like double-psi beta-barrel-protein domain-containing protein-containing protein n=1 Tax=Cokeromyces recurvatus TaxID=90255 RepID=UPI00221E84CA|nr:RlpA-like double-psi beta-barrel-protein domain-containing protein-containing protein [Cokeromyces recurvatus]KAI7897785.1 RlpA-like double-psi beta-barrel-protein domain-containing protein-containing protein [Cokeromyces recurvatus]
MNKINYFLFCIILLLFCNIQQVKSRPLNLAKTTEKILSSLGTGTYYDVAAGFGSCGEMNSNDDMVVAVNYIQMENGSNPNNNPRCDKKVKIIGKTRKVVTARIVDTCPGCSSGSLDMSTALFKKVCGDLALGVCKIKWDFI